MRQQKHRISLSHSPVTVTALLLLVVLVPAGCNPTAVPAPGTPDIPQPTDPFPHVPMAPVSHYTYEVVNAYPHDAQAFTQGLALEDGVLYEGTGLRGRSSLRKVDLETGEVMQSTALPDELFGEGVTILGDTIVQLTWQSGVGRVYDKADLHLLREFTYDTEGWGITYDGTRLIMSDGTARLYFLDPASFAVDYYVTVTDGNSEVTGLNELEFIDGKVYANVWPTNTIVVINPPDGCVNGWVDLSELLASRPSIRHVDVLNGIAYDAANGRFFVTGKLWPWLFEIRLIPV